MLEQRKKYHSSYQWTHCIYIEFLFSSLANNESLNCFQWSVQHGVIFPSPAKDLKIHEVSTECILITLSGSITLRNLWWNDFTVMNVETKACSRLLSESYISFTEVSTKNCYSFIITLVWFKWVACQYEFEFAGEIWFHCVIHPVYSIIINLLWSLSLHSSNPLQIAQKNFGKKSIIVHIQDAGGLLGRMFMVIGGVPFKWANSQQWFAKYSSHVKPSSIASLDLSTENSLFFLITLSRQTSNPAPLSLSAGLWRVRMWTEGESRHHN